MSTHPIHTVNMSFHQNPFSDESPELIQAILLPFGLRLLYKSICQSEQRIFEQDRCNQLVIEFKEIPDCEKQPTYFLFMWVDSIASAQPGSL